MKTFIYILLLSFFPLKTQAALTVLIDPGHGGEDKGAKSKQKDVFEKDIALNIAKKIKAEMPTNYKVYLTRSLDRNVSLENRAAMAETVKADIFVSVHINSSAQSRAHGLETYYLDNHGDAAVKKLEEAENKSFTGEDPIVNQILTDLIIQRTVETSTKLATSIHGHLLSGLKKFGMRDRGIRPGLFYVLALAKRPAVLLEIGFISNDTELQKIRSAAFQDSCAKAVAQGIVSYAQKLGK